MPIDTMARPQRHLSDHLSNSAVWSTFFEQGAFHDGDIVVTRPFNAGTTFTRQNLQQILVNGAARDTTLSASSPWLDSGWGNDAAMLAIPHQQAEPFDWHATTRRSGPACTATCATSDRRR